MFGFEFFHAKVIDLKCTHGVLTANYRVSCYISAHCPHILNCRVRNEADGKYEVKNLHFHTSRVSQGLKSMNTNELAQ